MVIIQIFTVNATEIIIVGAGLSGISAAVKLIENGFNDIVILEAEDRIGGRVHSVPFSNGYVDLGAQACHGEEGNAIFEMTHEHFEFGQPEYGTTEAQYFLSSGQPANQEQCKRLDLLFNSVYEAAQGQNKSLGSIIELEYEKALNNPEYSDIDKTLSRQMLTFFDKQTSADYAVESWFKLSVNYSLRFIQESKGNQILTWKREGFKKVFDFLTVRRHVQATF